MRIYPAVHYTMGGLWVDYNLQTTIPGLYACGEANFSDHGANRLGASALMQGLADGYFVLPYTIGITSRMTSERAPSPRIRRNSPKPKRSAIGLSSSTTGKTPVDDFHRRLGRIMWNECGMSHNETAEGHCRHRPSVRVSGMCGSQDAQTGSTRNSTRQDVCPT